MATGTMPDEYYERYSKLTQQELYNQLMAGSPTQVETVSDAWHTIGDTIGALATSLTTDLTTLSTGWEGPAAKEFQNQIGMIVGYAQKLVDEGASISSGLSVMATILQQRQQAAEPPQPVPVLPDQTTALIAVDPVLGAALGYTPTPEEQAKAQQRMTQLVAQLASDYAVTDHGSWPAQLPEAPPTLPSTLPPVVVTAGLAGAGTLTAATPTRLPVALPGMGIGGIGGLHGAPVAGPISEAAPATLAGAAANRNTAARSLPGAASGSGAASVSGTASTGTGAAGTGAAGGAAAGGSGGQPGAMPMGNVGAVARPVDADYAPLAEDGSAWSKSEEVAWHAPGETPPPILGPSTKH
jgi:uncharacterized protein YukE